MPWRPDVKSRVGDRCRCLTFRLISSHTSFDIFQIHLLTFECLLLVKTQLKNETSILFAGTMKVSSSSSDLLNLSQLFAHPDPLIDNYDADAEEVM